MKPVPELNACLVLKKGGMCLLLKRKQGFWEFPGGGVGFGESPAQAAARECREETGLRAGAGRLVCATSEVYPKNGKQKHSVYLVFEGSIKGKVGKIRLSSEHVEFGWFGLREMGQLELARNARPVLGYLKVG